MKSNIASFIIGGLLGYMSMDVYERYQKYAHPTVTIKQAAKTKVDSVKARIVEKLQGEKQ
jgi:hypothetical protein